MFYLSKLAFLFFLIPALVACRSHQDRAAIQGIEGSACAILAHPDDETIIGGTLAKLKDQGFELTVVYITSGDDGPDQTGRGLYGDALADEREKEAIQALEALGIPTPPVFLKFPDGHVHQYLDSVRGTLLTLFEQVKPQILISFGPDGITGDWDHKATGQASEMAFDLCSSGNLLLHMAITKPFPPFYANGVAVSRDSVDVRVKVSRYNKMRAQAMGAHHTQFNSRARSAYRVFVHAMRKEKYIIARDRNATEYLERYFSD